MGARHALWLLPEDRARGRLAVLIDELAAASGTTRFPPHVTLLSGLDLGPDGLLERARGLAAVLPPVPVRLARATHGPEFYRAVVLPVEGEAVTAARARAEEALETRGAAFHPHLSLVYGELSEPARRRIVAAIGGRGSGSCTLDELEVVATDGPPERWASLGRWPLRGQGALGHDGASSR